MNFVDYEKFREDLKRNCPKTPMNFRNIVDKAVERGLHGEAYRRERDKRRYSAHGTGGFCKQGRISDFAL